MHQTGRSNNCWTYGTTDNFCLPCTFYIFQNRYNEHALLFNQEEKTHHFKNKSSGLHCWIHGIQRCICVKRSGLDSFHRQQNNIMTFKISFPFPFVASLRFIPEITYSGTQESVFKSRTPDLLSCTEIVLRDCQDTNSC